MAEAADAEDAWQEMLQEETGKVYYYNEITGATQWEHPFGGEEGEEEGEEGEEGGAAEEGSSAWVTQIDPGTGKTYYYNEATGSTQWTLPSELGTFFYLVRSFLR